MLYLAKFWKKLARMVAVLVLLATIGTGCGGAKQELIQIKDRLAVLDNSVYAAQKTANEALVLAQSASPMGTSSDGEPILLASGIALTYELSGEQDLIAYPVDAVFAYPTYSDFRNAWENRPDVTVQLAWTAGTGEGSWHLVFSDEILVPGDPDVMLSNASLTHWHEFVVYTHVGTSRDTDPDLASLVVEQGVQQTVEDTLAVSTALSVEMLGQSTPDLGPFVQILLADTDDGQETYALVTILEPLFSLSPTPIPLPPDDLNDSGQQQCSNCVWGLCTLACWRYG